MILALLVLLGLAAAWVRVFWIVPAFHKRKGRICSKNGRGRLLIFLGSGGHTAEMLALLTNLPSRYADRLWLYSVGDNLSKEKVADWERRQFTKAISNTVVGIPRARMVGQYWILTPFTFLASLVLAALPVMRFDADILLINGPGTAVVIVTIIYILKVRKACHISVLTFTVLW